ncbi:MAG TPA: hypothetical protein VIQ53_16885 [Inquilinus sp.]
MARILENISSYDQVVGALRSYLENLTEAERDQIFGRSAIEAYLLPGLYD